MNDMIAVNVVNDISKSWSDLGLKSNFTPTQEQIEVLKALIDFLYCPVTEIKPESYLMALTGSGGVGKTTLLKLLIQYNNRGNNRRSLIGATLTHKSRKVLEHTINKDLLMKIPTLTIAALLKKVKLAGFVGTKKYRGKGSVLGDYDMVIVDEVSMVSDKDFYEIVNYARTYRTKVLFLGDPAQIAHPIQQYIEYEGKLEKKDSEAFKLSNRVHLEKVMRQALGNPILDICTAIRADLRKEGQLFPYVSRHNQYGGVSFMTDPVEFGEAMKQVFTNPEKVFQSKIIVYTNQSVEQYNHLIRHFRASVTATGEPSDASVRVGDQFKVNRSQSLISGDILMGYENIGYPQPWIENGQEYEVICIRKVKDQAIFNSTAVTNNKSKLGGFSQTTNNILGIAEGIIVVLREMLRGTDCEIIPGRSTTVFFPDIYNESNYQILQELVNRADKVNRYGSSMEDFKDYQHIKEQMLFMDSLYKINGEIMGEADFKRQHPLLNTRITELVQEEFILDDKGEPKGSKRILNNENKLYEEINTRYPNLIKNRAKDMNVLGDSEELKDIYKILNHDLRYGFAITAHKAQSSTYNTVFIDETDFDKISDRWNYKLNKPIRGTKERNQLKYVAYSRASHNVVVLCSDLTNPLDP